MSRKIIVALWAFALLIVTAWADTTAGGEGGCINLPGGRSGSRPGSLGGSSSTVWEISTPVSPTGLLLRLPEELFGAVAYMRGLSMPFAMTYGSVDGVVRLPEAAISALRAGDLGFTLDFISFTGARLHADVTFANGAELRLRIP